MGMSYEDGMNELSPRAPLTKPVEEVVEAAVGVVAEAAVQQSTAAAVEHDAMAEEHTEAAHKIANIQYLKDNRRRFWTKLASRFGIGILLLLAAYGAAIILQSVLSTFDENAAQRSAFVSRCVTSGNRVFEGDNHQWVCVRGDIASVTKTGGEGAPSVAEAKATCLKGGHLALVPFDAEMWVYCVDGSIVDVLK